MPFDPDRTYLPIPGGGSMRWPGLADAISAQLPPGTTCYPPVSLKLLHLALEAQVLVRPMGDPDAYLAELTAEEWRELVERAHREWRFGDDPFVPVLPDDLKGVRAIRPELGGDDE